MGNWAIGQRKEKPAEKRRTLMLLANRRSWGRQVGRAVEFGEFDSDTFLCRKRRKRRNPVNHRPESSAGRPGFRPDSPAALFLLGELGEKAKFTAVGECASSIKVEQGRRLLSLDLVARVFAA